MGNDDAKRLILARRAKFVALAMTGIAAACGGAEDSEKNPQPCLSPAYDAGRDTGADATPQPCLDPLPPDSGTDAGPQPCLSQVAPDAGDGGDGG